MGSGCFKMSAGVSKWIRDVSRWVPGFHDGFTGCFNMGSGF